MKININVDRLEPLYNSFVEDYLVAEGIPSCFGNMTPTIIHKWATVETEEIFAPEHLVAEDMIYSKDINFLFKEYKSGFSDSYVLTIEGYNKLKEAKKSKAKKHADRLAACFRCEHCSKCYLVTASYLNAVST